MGATAVNSLLDAVAVLGVAGCVLAALVVARSRASVGRARSRSQWLAWGVVVSVTAGIVGGTLSVLTGWPSTASRAWAVGCLVLPMAVALGRSTRTAAAGERVLVSTIVLAGLTVLVAAVYVIVVIGLGRVPEGHERTVLALSMVAGTLACVLAFPARRRLEEWANQRVYGERHSPDEALRTFGGRMSRAVPMDELLLQLVESLKKTMDLSAAEVWTGSGRHLARTISVPDRSAAELDLTSKEVAVVARAHAQGNAWIEMWAPGLLVGRERNVVRSVSVSHLGELLGLIVVERPPEGAPLTEEEDRVLVELARQVGLALHNVSLDSALQASLDELQIRNAELVASRSRIVAAADESRRQIERNLHDGAQQHLVSLAVKAGLIKTLWAADADAAIGMVDELRNDVQATLTELRELAHGIYPPLLRDRGLAEALRTAAMRASLPTVVEADEVARYDADVEAAVYFCCLEALQNAGKHAGCYELGRLW